MIRARSSAANAAACQRSPVPCVIAKDAVGLGDDMPPFHIMEISPVGVPRLDVPRLKLGPELADLRIAKRHHFVLTISTGWGLLSCAPGTSAPRLSSPRIGCRSSLGRCGTQ